MRGAIISADCTLQLEGASIHLTPKEAALFRSLGAQAGDVKTPTELMVSLFGSDTVSKNKLQVVICNLRRKLSFSRTVKIRTLKRGYVLEKRTQAEQIGDSSDLTYRPKNPPGHFIVYHVLDMIRVHGRPMTRTEIYEGLTQRGIVVKGKVPQRVLSTILWREKAAVALLPGFGYWPTNQKYDPANYDPFVI
jgi:DNA-binding winged helix-turn-helix (wHTH) protein